MSAPDLQSTARGQRLRSRRDIGPSPDSSSAPAWRPWPDVMLVRPRLAYVSVCSSNERSARASVSKPTTRITPNDDHNSLTHDSSSSTLIVIHYDTHAPSVTTVTPRTNAHQLPTAAGRLHTHARTLQPAHLTHVAIYTGVCIQVHIHPKHTVLVASDRLSRRPGHRVRSLGSQRVRVLHQLELPFGECSRHSPVGLI